MDSLTMPPNHGELSQRHRRPAARAPGIPSRGPTGRDWFAGRPRHVEAPARRCRNAPVATFYCSWRSAGFSTCSRRRF